MQGLEQLINLEDLFLNDNQLESVDNLQQCVKLSELRLSANKIATGAGIPSKLLLQLNVMGISADFFANIAHRSCEWTITN